MSWVQCWGMAHTSLALLRFASASQTFRLILNTAIAGESLRVRLSNEYGKGDVEIGALTAAKCDMRGTVAENEPFYDLTIGGKREFTIKKGMRIISDSLDMKLASGEYLCVNIYVKSGVLESGNSLDNAALRYCVGDCSHSAHINHAGRGKDGLQSRVMSLLGLYHPLPVPLFEDIELDNRDGASAIVCFGDSITEQGFWTNEFERIIREKFPGKYSVINKAITGNRLLYDSALFLLPGFFGEKAVKRVDRDVFEYENVTHAVICIGINDMLEYNTVSGRKSEKPEAQDMYDSLRDFYARFRAHGIKTVGMNYIAYGLSMDSNAEKNQLLARVNHWFDDNKSICDEYVDVYTLTGSASNPYNAEKELVGIDGLHPNALGGRIIAQAIPTRIFE